MLNFRRSGRGPEIVAVHGWGFSGQVFSELTDALATHAHITVVELPGYGQSHAVQTRYTLEALAAQVLELFDRPVIWMGWSLGAMIGLMAAHLRPSAIAKMVLIGATPRFVEASDWPHGVRTNEFRWFAEGVKRDCRAALARFLSLQTGSAQQAHTLLRRLRADMLGEAPHPSQAVLQAGLGLLWGADLRGVLASIGMPVLVIHGERDLLVPLAAATYLSEHLPHARLVTIAGAGHAPFWSHTRLVRARLVEFFNG